MFGMLKHRRLALTAEVKKLTYADIFWLFLFGSVIGFISEGVWSAWRFGAWANHSATVWGPFCIIYGFGMVALFLIARKVARYNVFLQFMLFCLGGAILEFVCGLLQELVFGSRSWDYGGPFYGFINLEMTLIWGAMGVVYAWLVFPSLNRLVGKFTHGGWLMACCLLSVVLLIDFAVTSLAVWRWGSRLQGVEARTRADSYLDLHYDNSRMSEIFPNMEFRKLGE